MVFYVKLRIQIFIHIFRGRLLHPWLENLSLDFISFINSNWVVINYQKGGDCKCNQALLWGFHQIRGLIRFIEMTSRESKNEDDVQVAGVLITKEICLQLISQYDNKS